MLNSESKKRIALLGSTGSIGTQSLEVARHLKDEIEIVGLCAGQQVELLSKQAKEFSAKWLMSQNNAELQKHVSSESRIIFDEDELCAAVSADNIDIVLCAISGTAGLKPVLSAIEAGKTIALASKEILVMAGEIVMQKAAQFSAKILPVDSEHCAIFQCLQGNKNEDIKRIFLTASGGPFHQNPGIDLATVSLEQALRHPTWNMGKKISIDSASMMNKALEVIEAAWLFNLKAEQIEVLVHPQSIVHSMIEFVDNSTIAQLSQPDMSLPIQFCLKYPERTASLCKELDFSESLKLDFFPLDNKRFPAVELAKKALKYKGAAGAVFNAANEVAVERFCRKEIKFNEISLLTHATLEALYNSPANSLEEIIAADQESRKFANLWKAQ